MVTIPRSRLTFSLVLLFLLWNATPSRAGLVLDLIVQPSTTLQGQSGSFDVIVKDDPTSTQSISIGGFSVSLTIDGGQGISITGISSNTGTTFIFPSANDLGLSSSSTATSASGNDFALMGGTLLNPGDAYGLVNITYTVASNAVIGAHTVTLQGIGGATSLSDAGGNNLSFTPTNGTITVDGSNAVPEPASIVSTLFGLGICLVYRRLRK